MKKLLYLLFLIPTLGYSAPVITTATGTFAQNGIISLNGSSFGLKPYASTPTIWADFEQGRLESGGIGYGANGHGQWSTMTVLNRTGSNYYAARNRVTVAGGELAYTQLIDATTWYQYMWVKLGSNGGKPCQSGKFWRIWGDVENYWITSGGALGTGLRGAQEYVSPAPIKTTIYGGNRGFGSEEWHLLEIKMSIHPSTFTTTLDGVPQWGWGDWVTPTFSGAGHTFGIGGYIDNPDATYDGHYDFDDYYADYSYCRVMISTTSTWSKSTMKEIQIPQSWGDNVIDVKYNPYRSESSNIIYFYVVDAQGNANEDGFLYNSTPYSPPLAPSAPKSFRGQMTIRGNVTIR